MKNTIGLFYGVTLGATLKKEIICNDNNYSGRVLFSSVCVNHISFLFRYEKPQKDCEFILGETYIQI